MKYAIVRNNAGIDEAVMRDRQIGVEGFCKLKNSEFDDSALQYFQNKLKTGDTVYSSGVNVFHSIESLYDFMRLVMKRGASLNVILKPDMGIVDGKPINPKILDTIECMLYHKGVAKGFVLPHYRITGDIEKIVDYIFDRSMFSLLLCVFGSK